LDIGSGSGYLSVCMALMMDFGHAYGLENPRNLSKLAKNNIFKSSHRSVIEDGKVIIIQ